jgi:predicted glycogen debranching enzyme
VLRIAFGREVLGSLEEASNREWLVTDGLGGYAMGTAGGLRTRRYHGLLVVATQPPIGRMLGLAALDPVLVVGDRRIRLATHEWAGGTVDPAGHLDLASFELIEGVPRWRWAVGDVVLEREVAMVHGRSAVGVVHRLIRAPGPVRLELGAVCAWRDVHGETWAGGNPSVEPVADGFVFEGAYRVHGPGYRPDGAWWQGARYRVEAERGLNDCEDLWFAGTFSAELDPGEEAGVTAWAGDLSDPPPPAASIVKSARDRARDVAMASKAADDVEETLAVAADQLIVEGPTVVAGYPWFGDWSRDTMTSFEGLFLETMRWDEGRRLLERAAGTLSEGMLANTADVGGAPEYNTADATLWFLHAVGRHVDVTGDLDLAATLVPSLEDVVERHVAGTRFGIGVDRTDGLLTQGADGWALTWMDARVDGRPITPRMGKAVEINALWINGLTSLALLQERLERDASRTRFLESSARRSFAGRFVRRGGILDVADGPYGDDAELRPNQLLAVSLPHAPLTDPSVIRACTPLVTSMGLRSLAPSDDCYIGRRRGGPAQRDEAYHEGTVWPWLIGPYVEGALRTGVDVTGVLDGLEAHLSEWGLGSVSETTDGDPPHAATGCPFQAWSVAELLRARRLMTRL